MYFLSSEQSENSRQTIIGAKPFPPNTSSERRSPKDVSHGSAENIHTYLHTNIHLVVEWSKRAAALRCEGNSNEDIAPSCVVL